MSAFYGLIGHPLGHSLSPFIHARLFALSTVDAQYDLYDIAPSDLSARLPALFDTLCGFNVTIPHKQAIVPMLDRLEGKAARYRTVNTVAVSERGTVGFNTDVDGFLLALSEAGVPLKGRVCLLGTGGAATVFACEAALNGCEVTVLRPRNAATAKALCERVNEVAPQACCRVADAIDGRVDLLLNATPVGMYPSVDACPAEEELLSRCSAVFDAIYNPRRTRLLDTAATHGAVTVGGMAMLVWQAVEAHRHWYGAQFQNADIAALIQDCYTELEAHFQ